MKAVRGGVPPAEIPVGTPFPSWWERGGWEEILARFEPVFLVAAWMALVWLV